MKFKGLKKRPVELSPNPMIKENQQSVTNKPVEVEDYRKITDHFRGIYRIYPYLTKENWRM